MQASSSMSLRETWKLARHTETYSSTFLGLRRHKTDCHILCACALTPLVVHGPADRPY